MKSRSMVQLRLVGFAVFTILLAGISTTSRAQNRCLQLSQAPLWIQAQAGSLLAQGATIDCDSTNVYITMPSGLFFRITVADDGSVSAFSFDPSSGHVISWYVLGGDGNNPPT